MASGAEHTTTVSTLDLADVSDSIVLHFAGEASRINAYTLAAAISGIADAAKATNAIVNPGYEIEIVVEALSPGSFRTLLRAITRERRNLFSADSARTIILSIVATVLYERVLSPKPSVVVNVNPTEVVIVSGNDRIVVPRTVYDASKQAESTMDSTMTSSLIGLPSPLGIRCVCAYGCDRHVWPTLASS
jgi:hypothetical protein